MRQRVNDQKEILVRKPKDKEGMVFGWTREESVLIKAIVRPFGPSSSGGPLQVLASQYGDRVLKMGMLYYAGKIELQERDGLCINTNFNELCDYRIVAIMRWSRLQQAVIEYIPEGRRA